MKLSRWMTRASLVAVAVAFTACSGDFVDPMTSTDLSRSTAGTGYLDVYKVGPDGFYSFTSTVEGEVYRTVEVEANGPRRTIWSEGDPMASPVDVTVTENVPAGMQVDSIVVRVFDNGAYTYGETLTGTGSVTIPDMANTRDAAVKFFNSEVPGEPGLEGCTPGYWKQVQHFGNWTGYTPDQQFSDVFEDAFPGMTLLEVLGQGGGGLKALGRHTVAALLNASGSVDYPVTSAQAVIDAFNGVVPDGGVEDLKNEFEGYNELGCTLGRAELEVDGGLERGGQGNRGRGAGNGNAGKGRGGR
ncbi:MAG TPA: hypothetical protein VK966_11205 [Longimicrobiales bacterium]|nr:hypothetical protein [Longimicrobiales bacterium]